MYIIATSAVIQRVYNRRYHVYGLAKLPSF